MIPCVLPRQTGRPYRLDQGSTSHGIHLRWLLSRHVGAHRRLLEQQSNHTALVALAVEVEGRVMVAKKVGGSVTVLVVDLLVALAVAGEKVALVDLVVALRAVVRTVVAVKVAGSR